LTRVFAPLVMAMASVPLSYAAPLLQITKEHGGDGDGAKPADDPSLWIYLGTAMALVLMGGVFAGLTIAYVIFLSFIYVHYKDSPSITIISRDKEKQTLRTHITGSWAKTKSTFKYSHNQAKEQNVKMHVASSTY
jgi:hypothetical protein